MILLTKEASSCRASPFYSRYLSSSMDTKESRNFVNKILVGVVQDIGAVAPKN